MIGWVNIISMFMLIVGGSVLILAVLEWSDRRYLKKHHTPWWEDKD